MFFSQFETYWSYFWSREPALAQWHHVNAGLPDVGWTCAQTGPGQNHGKTPDPRPAELGSNRFGDEWSLGFQGPELFFWFVLGHFDWLKKPSNSLNHSDVHVGDSNKFRYSRYSIIEKWMVHTQTPEFVDASEPSMSPAPLKMVLHGSSTRPAEELCLASLVVMAPYPDGTLYSWLLNGSSSYGNFITWLPISHWNKKGMILLWPSTTSDLKHACGWHRAFTWHVSGLRRTNRNNIWENMWWPLHCHNSASSQPLFHPHSSPVLLGSEVTTPISLVKSKKGVFTIQIHAPNLNLG